MVSEGVEFSGKTRGAEGCYCELKKKKTVDKIRKEMVTESDGGSGGGM